MTDTPAPEITWQNAAPWPVGGRGWAQAAAWTRFPDHAEATLPVHLWDASKQSTGQVLHGSIDGPGPLHVRYRLRLESLAMSHMPATCRSGMCLYLQRPDGTWFYSATVRPDKQDVTAAIPLRPAADGPRAFQLYLPLYNGLETLDLGVQPGTRIQPLPPVGADRKPVVVYGTSITQGGCASRPGMVYTSILQRRLGREFINLGFSGAARCEEAMTDLFCELDPALFILDHVRNCSGLEPAVYDQRLRYLITRLRQARPTTPILWLTAQDPYVLELNHAYYRRSEAPVRALMAELPNIHLLDCYAAIGTDGEATVDGVHLTDLGYLRLADAIEPTLRGLLT